MYRTNVRWTTIAFVFATLASAVPFVGTAQDVEVEIESATANGCTFAARKPAKIAADVVARAGVECFTALEGREIIVELWQRDNDGNWHMISDATTSWKDADQAQPLHDADANSIYCKDLDSGRTRRFKSRILVSDGTDNFRAAFSNAVDLDRNCLAESGIQLSGAPVATESGEVEAESTHFNQDVLVFCVTRAYDPSRPQPGGRMYAKA